MRKRLNLHIALVSLVAILGCSNELDLLDPRDPIPVVYGVLCPDDSVLRIRLTKSFLGDNTPHQDAKINDSLYFSDAEVFLDLRDDEGRVLERCKLLETIIIDRQPGIFSRHPNKVYQAEGFALRQPYRSSGMMTYTLSIYLPKYDNTVIAQTNVPPNPKLNIDIEENEKINLFDMYSNPRKASFGFDEDYAIEFNFLVHYEELKNGRWTSKTINYQRRYDVLGDARSFDAILYIVPEWFFPMIGGKIKNDPEVEKRKFKEISVNQKLISPEFFDYKASIDYSSDFYQSSYSNVINGKGIFTSYSISEIHGITLNQQMLDSLALGRYTKHLRFSRW